MPDPSLSKAKVTPRFMLSHPAHMIALGFGSGLSPIMPGSVGTLLAWLMFVAFTSRWPSVFGPMTWGMMIVLGFVLGVWVCQRTGDDCGIADHSAMVWDEMVAFWLVLVVITPVGVWTQCAAFLLFRFFDIVKPPPIAYFDQHLKGGLGVMWDDIMAAFYTLLVFALWRTLVVL